MRQLRTRRRLLAEVTAGVVAIAGGQAAAAEASAAEAPENGVKAVIDAFFAAARRHDWDATGQLMSENVRIWLDGDESMGREEYVVVMKEDDLEVVDIKLDDLDIRVSRDSSMAWSRYRATVEGISKGKRSSVKTAETILFDRVEQEWLMRHIHVSLVRRA